MAKAKLHRSLAVAGWSFVACAALCPGQAFADPDGPVPLAPGRPLPFPVVNESDSKAPPFTAPGDLPEDMVYLTAPNLLAGAKHENVLHRTVRHFESIAVRQSTIAGDKVTIPRGGLTYVTEPWPGSAPMVKDAIFLKGVPHTLIDFNQSIVVRKDFGLRPGESVTVGSNIFTHALGLVVTGTFASAINVTAISGLDWAPAGVGSFAVSSTQPGWDGPSFHHALYQGRVEDAGPRGVQFAWLSANRTDALVLASKQEFSGKLKSGGEVPLSNGKKVRITAIDAANKKVDLETPEGPKSFSANFDLKLLVEDTEARSKVIFVGKDFAVYFIPFFSDWDSGEIHLEVYSGLTTIKYDQPLATDAAWRTYPVGCYTGHSGGVYMINEQPIELSAKAPTAKGPDGAFTLVTSWNASGALESFGIEDQKGGKSMMVPAKGRKTINLLAGDGPTVQSLLKTVGVATVSQMYALLSGEGPKPVVSLKATAPKAAATASADEPGPASALTLKITWAVVGAALAGLAFMGIGTLRKK